MSHTSMHIVVTIYVIVGNRAVTGVTAEVR
jgi:hypothetical protein